PDVAHVISNVGGFGAGTTNTATMFIALKDKPERKASARAVIDRLRKSVAQVQGIMFLPAVVQDVRIGGPGSRRAYIYTLEDANIDELNQWGPKVTAAVRKLPEVRDVNSDQQTGGLELDIDIDRDTAARLGITAAMIDNVLYDAFGQRQVAVFYTE